MPGAAARGAPLCAEAAAGPCLLLCGGGCGALLHHQLSCYLHHLSDYSLPGNKECVIFFFKDANCSLN